MHGSTYGSREDLAHPKNLRFAFKESMEAFHSFCHFRFLAFFEAMLHTGPLPPMRLQAGLIVQSILDLEKVRKQTVLLR